MDKNNLLKLSYRYLSIRQRSQSEITQYLAKKTTNQDLINQVLTTLKDQGFIDDAEFVNQYIESYLNKGHGPRKIRFNLLNKGVDKHLISSTLESISNQQWLQSAKIIISKKDHQLKHLNPLKRKQKIYNLLTYRGHSYQTIKTVIDAYPHLE